MAWSARGMATSKADLVDEAAREAAAVLHELLNAPVQGNSLEELAAVFQDQRWKSNAMLESEAERMVTKAKHMHDALKKCQKDLQDMEWRPVCPSLLNGRRPESTRPGTMGRTGVPPWEFLLS